MGWKLYLFCSYQDQAHFLSNTWCQIKLAEFWTPNGELPVSYWGTVVSYASPPAIMTFSNKGRLFDENLFLFQDLFQLFCNWYKIAQGLSLLRPSIFLPYSMQSSASILSLQLHTSLPCLLCNFFSKLVFSHTLLLATLPSSFFSVSLPCVPTCTPLSNCGYTCSAQPFANLRWSYLLPNPHNSLFVVSFQTIPTHPLPQPCPTEHCYLKGQFPTNAVL